MRGRVGSALLRGEESLWGRRVVGAALQDAGQLPPADALVRTRLAGTWMTEAVVELRFERGWPVAVNGVPMPLVDLLDSVGTIAGAHGVGRSVIGERRAGPAEPRDSRIAGARRATTGARRRHGDGRAAGL